MADYFSKEWNDITVAFPTNILKIDITIYGKVVEKTKTGSGKFLQDSFVKSLSQEHGIVKVPIKDFESYTIRDYLLNLPIHSCMTVDVMKNYLTKGRQHISTLNTL